MISSTCDLKNWGMKGAERFMAKTFAALSAWR
jgi:hypothetical protein